MSWRRWLVSALVVLAFGMSTVVCQRVADRGRFAAPYSSYGSGPEGSRALFLLAERMGRKARRWSQELTGLPERGVLVALGGCEVGVVRPLTRYEKQELSSWVEAGGVLLVAGTRRFLPREMPVRFEPEKGCLPKWALWFGQELADAEDREEDSSPEPQPQPGGDAEQPDLFREALDAALDDEPRWSAPVAPPLLGLDAVPMKRPGRLVVDPDADSVTLLTMPDAPDMPVSSVQRPTAIVVDKGRGKIIVLASASPFQNQALRHADGGVLFARLLDRFAPAQPVFFDEYHLGMGERRSLMQYLGSRGAGPLFFQLGVIVLVLLFAAGRRFGAPRLEPRPPPQDTASFVDALGRLFARSLDAPGALDIIIQQALRRIALHHHLVFAQPRRLENELRARGAASAADAVATIVKVPLNLKNNPASLVAAARRIDAAVVEAIQ